VASGRGGGVGGRSRTAAPGREGSWGGDTPVTVTVEGTTAPFRRGGRVTLARVAEPLRRPSSIPGTRRGEQDNPYSGGACMSAKGVELQVLLCFPSWRGNEDTFVASQQSHLTRGCSNLIHRQGRWRERECVIV